MSTDRPDRRDAAPAAYDDQATQRMPVDADGRAYDDRSAADARTYDDGRTYTDGRPVDADGRPVDAEGRRYDTTANSTAAHTTTTGGAPIADRAVARDVLARERERFGGMKFGSAFFGWLTATGLVVLLTAIVAAIGAAVGLVAPQTAEDAANAANENLGAATIIGAIVVGIVLFVGYYAGGYVAGRMARFSGLKQGLAVWLWALIVAIIVAIVSAIAGSQWNILGTVDTFPQIPVSPDQLTLTGILTAVGALIVTLAGALLGGVAGMRYHRRVDRVGLGLED